MMKNYFYLILLLLCSYSVISDEITDKKSGLPMVFTVGEILKMKQSDLIKKSTAVTGFVFYSKNDGLSYLFPDISSLVSFDIKQQLIVEVSKNNEHLFQRWNLCHVLLRGTFKKNGMSLTNSVLGSITEISPNEVFLFDLNTEQQEKSYKCFVSKVIGMGN
jgi:hypothetical protein